MNSPTHYPKPLDHRRQHFERLVNPPEGITNTANGPNPLVRSLLTLGDNIVRFLTADQQPRIWHRTRHGRQVWFTYDPLTDQRRQFFSEHEVRLWLDTRYYE